MIKRTVLLFAMPALLWGCTSQWDMQGKDPKEHYKVQPVKNRVETQTQMVTVHFPAGRNRLSADERDALKAGLSKVSPMAVESVQVMLSPKQMHNDERKAHINKMLRAMGYRKYTLMYEPSDTVAVNDANIAVSYAVVISPKCPDWRTSSVTTYSNTGKGGFGCSAATNLGAMVADPRDLEKGSDTVEPSAERNSLVLDSYRKGESVENEVNASTTSSVATGATTQ